MKRTNPDETPFFKDTKLLKDILLGNNTDPLIFEEKFEVQGPFQDQGPENLKKEFTTPDGRYKIQTYQLNTKTFAHIVWDYTAWGEECCSEPFLKKDDAILMSYNTYTCKDALCWHAKAVAYFSQQDPSKQ